MEQDIIKDHINCIYQDILTASAEAMVLSASSDMHRPVGTGLDQAVYEKAGRDGLIAEREQVLSEAGITRLRPGDIFVTSAGSGSLNVTKYIIHVIAPRYRKKYIEEGIDKNLVFLEDVIRNIFYKARDLSIQKLVMPLIGTGALGFRPEDVKKVINEAFLGVWKSDKDFFKDFRLIIVCLKKDEEKKKRMEGLPGVDEIIKTMKDYGFDIPDFSNKDYACVKRWVDSIDDTIKEITGLSRRSREFKELEHDMVKALIEKTRYTNKKTKPAPPKNRFVDLIDTYENDCKLTDSALCKKAHISKSIISRLRSGQRKSIGRENVIKLALAFELPLNEAKEFIRFGCAGFEFPDPNDERELAIVKCIENGIYDVEVIEDVFKEYPEYPEYSKDKRKKKSEPERGYDNIDR